MTKYFNNKIEINIYFLQLPEKSQRDNFPIDKVFTKELLPYKEVSTNGMENINQDDCLWQTHKKPIEKWPNKRDEVKVQHEVPTFGKNSHIKKIIYFSCFQIHISK